MSPAGAVGGGELEDRDLGAGIEPEWQERGAEAAGCVDLRPGSAAQALIVEGGLAVEGSESRNPYLPPVRVARDNEVDVVDVAAALLRLVGVVGQEEGEIPHVGGWQAEPGPTLLKVVDTRDAERGLTPSDEDVTVGQVPDPGVLLEGVCPGRGSGVGAVVIPGDGVYSEGCPEPAYRVQRPPQVLRSCIDEVAGERDEVRSRRHGATNGAAQE